MNEHHYRIVRSSLSMTWCLFVDGLSNKFEQKNGPFRGHVSRGDDWWVMSGKAMHDAVPPARTAVMEVTLIEESEGHVTEFAAS